MTTHYWSNGDVVEETEQDVQEFKNEQQIDKLVYELGPFTEDELRLLAETDDSPPTTQSMHIVDDNVDTGIDVYKYWRN